MARKIRHYVFEKTITEKYWATSEEEARAELEGMYGEAEAKEFELTDVVTYTETK